MSTAVVTGGARGIGKAIVGRLIRDGYDVAAVDRDAEALGKTCAALGATPFVLDVADEDMVAALTVRLGGCQVLVNNAGIWRPAGLLDTGVADALQVIGTNVLAPFLLMRALVPLMPRGSAIVNVSSVAAASTPGGLGLYPPAKAALETLTRMAAIEFGPLGIRCNAVGPGLVPTEGSADHYGDRDTIARRGALLPLGRYGTPEDIAAVVAFLCSDDACYVTGQVLYADGGYTIGGAEFFRAATSRHHDLGSSTP